MDRIPCLVRFMNYENKPMYVCSIDWPDRGGVPGCVIRFVPVIGRLPESRSYIDEDGRLCSCETNTDQLSDFSSTDAAYKALIAFCNDPANKIKVEGYWA
jgi:hypothetical protein